MEGSGRIQFIDVAKGIGIFLVVFGHIHSQFHIDLRGTFRFLSLFHVPVFFFISGFFFNEHQPFFSFLKKKCLRLYIPYLAVNVFFFWLETFYYGVQMDKIDWSSFVLAIVGLEPIHNSLAGPSWFILVLFRVCILYMIFQIVLRRRQVLVTLLSVSLSLLGLLSSVEFFFFRQTLIALLFFCLGHILGPTIRLYSRNVKICTILLLVSVVLLAILSEYQVTDMSVNHYGNKLLFFLGAIIGIAGTIALSSIIEMTSISLTRFWSFIGRNSMSILLMHLLFMKIVFTTLGGIINNIILSIIGITIAVVVPCAMSQIYSKFKNRIWSR